MKKLFILSCFLVIGNVLLAQEGILDGLYEKEHVPARKPIPYNPLREADVAWQKRIWRMLDLRQKINHPLYFPTEPMNDRYSLMSLVLWAIDNEGLIVYGTNDDEFKTPASRTEIDKALGASVDTVQVADENGELVSKASVTDPKPEQVYEIQLKEDWYFDRQRSMLQVRIIGFCPIRHYFKTGTEEGEDAEVTKVQVCWVYFPSIRYILANHAVFNTNNDAERRTFDDIFFKRKFGSYIYAETNVYNNRLVNQYKMGMDAILESDAIAKKIFDFEQDLWEY